TPRGLLLLIVAALASNVLVARLPVRITESTAFYAGVILGDTLWITATLIYSGLSGADFFYLYFFVLLLAGIGESVGLIAVGATVVCIAYVFVLSATGGSASLWSSRLLIRIPFLITAAAFYGYIVDRVRRERQHAREEAETVAHLEEAKHELSEHAQQLERANEDLAREISERERAEQALKAAKDYAESLIGSSLDMIVSTDVNRNIVEFNQAAEDAFGYSKVEVIDKPISILYADLSEGLRVRTNLGENGRFAGEVRNKRKNGEGFYSFLSASVIRDANGAIVGGVGVSRDITEQKRAEEALRWLEKAVETMELGVTITNTDGNIVYTNPADASMHGYTLEELICKDVQIFAPRDLWKPMALNQMNEIDSWTRESLNIRKDGTTFPVQVMSSAVTNAAGATIGIVTLCEDITERKRAEEELKAAQLQLIQSEKLESVGRLAAGVAHEVKNPLAIILQGLAYLSHVPSTADDDNVAMVLQKMDNAVKRADRVIGGLLDFSAQRAGDVRPADVNAVLEQSLLLVKHELVKAHVTLVKKLGQDLPPLMLDRHKIEQVFVNLFLNAIQAMPEGGTLTVKTNAKQPRELGPGDGRQQTDPVRGEETLVMIEVEDTGTGIPQDKLDRIFDPFFTTKPIGQGTGLGLTVTRKIIELHSGKIDIRNRHEGGVRVTLTFKKERGEDDAQETDPAD
ncbi:MAG: PAS domain S-box protein, partial [Candidatus Binatia bacterium]